MQMLQLGTVGFQHKSWHESLTDTEGRLSYFDIPSNCSDISTKLVGKLDDDSADKCLRLQVLMAGVSEQHGITSGSFITFDRWRHQGAEKLSDLILFTQKMKNGAPSYIPSFPLAYTPQTLIVHSSRHQEFESGVLERCFIYPVAASQETPHMLMEQNSFLRTLQICFIHTFLL